MKTGFDNEKYLKIQSEQIKKRIAQFGDKLYLEFGGKLFDDNHASRVLPGFKPDSKLDMLKQLKDEAEIIIVISSKDIEKNKVRGDLGITYDEDVLLDLFGLYLQILFVVKSRFHTGYKDNKYAFVLQVRNSKNRVGGKPTLCAIGRTVSRFLFYPVIYLLDLPPGKGRAALLSLRTLRYT